MDELVSQAELDAQIAAEIQHIAERPDPMVQALQRARRMIQDELKIIVVKHDLKDQRVTLVARDLMDSLINLDRALTRLSGE